MFERLTDKARSVIVQAQEEARSFTHCCIGSEHLLVALIGDEDGEWGLAQEVLYSLDVDANFVRGRIKRLVSPERRRQGQLPFTPRSKKILEISLRESLSLGHNFIGPEHILLGLVREGEESDDPKGIAYRILLELDLDGEKVRSTFLEQLARGHRGVRTPSRVFLKRSLRTRRLLDELRTRRVAPDSEIARLRTQLEEMFASD